LSGEHSSSNEFEVRVHKCFGRIFELLQQVDGVVKQKAENEESTGAEGPFCDLRDWVEEAILQCHLAWQYHRLSKGPAKVDTWEKVRDKNKDTDSE
jgi:hypothetical protein